MPPLPGNDVQEHWPSLLAVDLGFSVNKYTYWALIWWAQSEGTPKRWHNPLATTFACCGGKDVNSAGVKGYPTVEAGATATARTLRLDYYKDVVRELRRGNSYVALWKAINASPWCKGCQKGRYPVVLYQNLGAAAPPLPGDSSGTTPVHGAIEQQWDWSTKVAATGQRGIEAHPNIAAAVKAMHDIRG